MRSIQHWACFCGVVDVGEILNFIQSVHQYTTSRWITVNYPSRVVLVGTIKFI